VTFKILCERGGEKWQAYSVSAKTSGAKFLKESADAEAAAIQKQWPDVTATVLPAAEADEKVTA
jgi:hypothetical protein